MRAFFGMAAEEHQPSVAEAKLGAEEPEDRVAPNKSANSVADLKLSAADDQVANSTLDGAADADDMAFDIVPDTKAASMSPTRPVAGLQLDLSLAAAIAKERDEGKDMTEEAMIARQDAMPVLIIFELPDGSQLEKEFQMGQTVEVLKSFIASEVGMPMADQSMFLDTNPAELMDPMSLLDYAVGSAPLLPSPHRLTASSVPFTLCAVPHRLTPRTKSWSESRASWTTRERRNKPCWLTVPDPATVYKSPWVGFVSSVAAVASRTDK